MDNIRARQVLNEFAMRHADLTVLESQKMVDFEHELFDKQLALVKDPSKTKAVLASRRSGKSYSAAFYMVKTAYENKGSHIAYIALSRSSAFDIMWNEICNVLDRYGIKYKTDKNKQQFKLLHNNSRITLTGATSERVVENHRGLKYHLVVIDECAAPRFLPILESFIENIIEPTLMDYDGTLLLISTPGLVCTGFFYKVTTGQLPGWSVHKWTVLDNSRFPLWRGKKDWRKRAKALLDNKKDKKGWDDNTPVFRREYKGEWVEGSGDIIYPFSESNNMFQELPDIDFEYIFGIDFGIIDHSTIVVGAYSNESPNFWIVDTFKKNKLAPSSFADIIKRYYDMYEPNVIVGDSGGQGKAFIEEIEKHFDLPIEAAIKTGKLGMIDLMSDDFRQGKVKVRENLRELQAELFASFH